MGWVFLSGDCYYWDELRYQSVSKEKPIDTIMITSRNGSCKKILITLPFLVTKSAPFFLCQVIHRVNQGPVVWRPISTNPGLERFSYDLEMKTRTKQKQRINRNRAIWLVYRTDTNARGLSLVKRTLGWKNLRAENFLKNQSILRFDIIVQHD